MADDLRHRIAEATRAHYLDGTDWEGNDTCVCGGFGDGKDTADWDAHLADAVMAVRDDELWMERTAADCLADLLRDAHGELERLREENAYCLEALKGAENRRQAWRERAETAEAANDRVRALHPSAEEAHAAENVLCLECGVPAPCATRKALDGPQEVDRG